MWEYELTLIAGHGWQGRIAGIDEAGRGPLAGPVVAAAVILPPRLYLPRLDDSKALSPKVREHLAAGIKANATAWAVAEVSAAEIDRDNILVASQHAMRRALAAIMPYGIAAALVDGRAVPGLACAHTAIVRGDSLSPSIAAASVLAKAHRDSVMCALDVQYPGYGFAEHKGYPTAAHVAALGRLGPCPVHRSSFRWRHLLP